MNFLYNPGTFYAEDGSNSMLMQYSTKIEPVFDAKKYNAIETMLSNRSLQLQNTAETLYEINSKDNYDQALITLRIVRELHSDFEKKTTAFREWYRKIKKIPWTHAISNEGHHKDYVFHASEYATGCTLDEKTGAVMRQLARFVEQFLDTYEQFDLSNEHHTIYWDIIVNGVFDGYCFDAQIEGRYLNALILQYIMNIKKEGSPRDNLFSEIELLAKKMVISQNQLKENFSKIVDFLNEDSEIRQHIESLFSACKQKTFLY